MRFHQLNGDDGRQSFFEVVSRQVGVFFFKDFCFARFVVDGARQSRSKSGDVCPSLNRINEVCKGEDALQVAVVVLNGDFHRCLLFFAGNHNGRGEADLFSPIEVFHKRAEPSLIVVRFGLSLRIAQVFKNNGDMGI